jgi:hypothetical protein
MERQEQQSTNNFNLAGTVLNPPAKEFKAKRLVAQTKPETKEQLQILKPLQKTHRAIRVDDQLSSSAVPEGLLRILQRLFNQDDADGLESFLAQINTSVEIKGSWTRYAAKL